MTVARKVARNSLVQLAGRGVTMGVSLAALTLLSRYLGPHRFGQYQLVIAFLTLVNVSDLGVATIAVRHLSTSQREPEELMGNVLTVRTLLAFVSSALAIGASFALGYPYEIKMAIAVATMKTDRTPPAGCTRAEKRWFGGLSTRTVWPRASAIRPPAPNWNRSSCVRADSHETIVPAVANASTRRVPFKRSSAAAAARASAIAQSSVR